MMTKEELFDSLADDGLSRLTAAVPDRFARINHAAHAAMPCMLCLPDSTNLLSVEGLWTQLLVRLSCTAWECAKPDATQRLTAFGSRRPRTVISSLAREHAKAQSMATASGFKLHPEDILRLMRELSRDDNLHHDFRGLAENYRLLLLAIDPPSGTLLHRWLKGRAQVHFAQAEAIRRETLP